MSLCLCVPPILPDQLGSMHCLEEELLDNWSDGFPLHALPYCGIGLQFPCHSLYGLAGGFQFSWWCFVVLDASILGYLYI